MAKIYVILMTMTALLVTSGVAQAVYAVPEIDPGTATSALTLLIGGVLILTARVRR